MQIQINGHAISASGPGHFGFRAFPRGFWYGTIDGRSSTAPCGSEIHAIESAKHALLSGGHIATLKTEIGCMNHWRDTQGEPYAAQAIERLEALQSALDRAEQTFNSLSN